MLLLAGIVLAVFVVPWPWGLVTVVAGGLLDVGESLAFMKWSRRRNAAVGVEALVGRSAVVATPTQVRVAGELWEARGGGAPLRVGETVVVRAVEGLTLVVE